MKIRCTIEFDPFSHIECAGIAVADVVQKYIEPIHLCDDPLIALATGNDLYNSESRQVKVRLRKDAVEQIARELARVIVKGLESRDTLNGYPLVKEV